VILADTSAWVEFDRATGSAVDRRLTSLISEDGPLAVTEPIVMEVLARAHHGPREDDLRRLMLRFDLLRFDAAVDLDAAMRIYRRSRHAEIIPKGMVQCMVASVAWRSGAALLTSDRTLIRIARVVGIEVDRASLHGQSSTHGQSVQPGQPTAAPPAAPARRARRR